MSNPLLAASELPYEAVPFDQIRTSHFVPALDAAIAEAQAHIARLRSDAAPATFENTFLALEAATATAYDVAYVYSSLRHANGDAEMQALAKEVMPKLIELESDVHLDPVLYRRVQAASAAMAAALAADPKAFSPEQQTLADRKLQQFRRNGGLLDDGGKRRLRDLDEELSVLGPAFSQNVLKATNSFELILTDAHALAGLPTSAIEAAAQAATERGRPGTWVITLDAPSAGPFLLYADDRDLRRQVWVALNSRAASGPNGNEDLVRQIAGKRHARAKLLGFESHAHFQMQERMAEHPDRVREFLGRLLTKAKPAALAELAGLREYMHAHGADHELASWDYAYWARKCKEERFGLNAEALRPYFPLPAVLDGAFEHARRLYDLEFRVAADVPVYAQDVQVFEVFQGRTGEFMGLFYTDFHPRPTKGGGAWCTRFRPQWQDGAQSHRPHVSIVCNFSKPTGGKPSLLTFQEATTLFHEFGHALHSLLSRCAFRSLSCTSVFRDFVELPSQIMENWLREKEGLAIVARHYLTGAELPDELVTKLGESDHFHAGYMLMRQLRFAYLDLAWYAGDPEGVSDVAAFERAAVQPTDLLPLVAGTNISCSFEHIFSGGYSAGYYGYKWAEVLDADAFELFKERGIFARDVADRFRLAVLERGGSEHPMHLYKEFRGRSPDPDALLRRSQLI